MIQTEQALLEIATADGRRYYGQPVSSEGSSLRARLPGDIPEGSGLSPGDPVVLSILQGSTLRACVARVLSAEPGMAEFLVSDCRQRRDRRLHRRVPLDCPVMLQARRPDGAATAWREARGVDVSLGGMRLLSPRPLAADAEIHVRFQPLGPAPGGRAARRRVLGDTGTAISGGDDGVVAAVARLVAATPLDGGWTDVRLAFRMVPEGSRMVLARHLARCGVRPARGRAGGPAGSPIVRR